MAPTPHRDAGTPAAAGIVFPAGPDGARSTARAGAAIVAAALGPLDAAHAAAARDEPDWRRAYPTHLRRLTEGGLADPRAAVDAARAGLDAAWRTLAWADGSGGERPLASAWAVPPRVSPLRGHVLRGEGDARPARWQVPWRGEPLAGDALRRRIDAWARDGVIEPGAAEALHRCASHPEWFDLSDRTMVLLGAGSEAGPLGWLSRWRANLVAVDVGRPAVWRRIAGVVRAGNATLRVPLRADATGAGEDWTATAGADLLARAPDVADWLRGLDTDLDVAALAYLDGERHVRVSIAMDWVQRACSDARPGTTLAFLATPTDVFAVSGSTAEEAMRRWAARGPATRALQAAVRRAGGGRFFAPNVERLVVSPGGARWGVVDAVFLEQGPNYALAKRLQQWRATVARAAGRRVSLTVAPSTTSASVVSNPALAAGFAGADLFRVQAFEPATTNALTAALWVHDLRSDASAANPARPLAHPYQAFAEGACPGGLWTCAYRPRTAMPFAAAVGWARLKAGRAQR